MKCELYKKSGELIGTLDNQQRPVVYKEGSLKAWSLQGEFSGQDHAINLMSRDILDVIICCENGECKGECFITRAEIDGHIHITGTGPIEGPDIAIQELI